MKTIIVLALLFIFFVHFIICIICFIIIRKITKSRCGQIEYAITMIIVSILQIFIAYNPFIAYEDTYFILLVLLLLFCINIHVSTKRYNDAVVDKSTQYLIYFSPVSTLLIFWGHFILLGGIYRMDEPRILYLILLIFVNIVPIAVLYSKESDINIKKSDIPVNYRKIFRELYPDKMMNIIKLNDDYIYINDFEYSIKHYQDRHIITAYRDIDKEHLLTKYFKEKGLHQMGFHYRNAYFELTDEEYSNMLAEIKAMKNVILVNYPFIVIKNVNIFIRNNGIKYGVVLLKSDREKLHNELDELKTISKEMENEEYVCYAGLKREDVMGWIQQKHLKNPLNLSNLAQ